MLGSHREKMKCSEFSLAYSLVLDGQANGRERSLAETHLLECHGCERIASQIRRLGDEIASLDRPQLSAEDSRQIVAALHREARLKAISARKREERIDLWRLRLFSQSIGAVVSVGLLLVVVAAVFQPAYRALLALASAAIETTVEVEVIPEDVRFKILLLEPPPPPPIFNPSGALLGFSESLAEEDMLIATVKVRKDGRASVKALTEGSRDPSALDRLSNALFKQANFQPVRRNQSNSPDAVLMFTKINISG